MSIDDKLEFGKYSGMTPRELLKMKKGQYLMWCLANMKNFHIEPLSFEMAILERYSKQYYLKNLP